MKAEHVGLNKKVAELILISPNQSNEFYASHLNCKPQTISNILYWINLTSALEKQNAKAADICDKLEKKFNHEEIYMEVCKKQSYKDFIVFVDDAPTVGDPQFDKPKFYKSVNVII